MMKKGAIVILFSFLLIFYNIAISFALQQEYNLTYDGNGNLIQGFGKNFTYNGFNELINVKDENGDLIAEYLYDHEGSRIKKIEYIDGENITTYYLDESFIQVSNSSGTFNTTYYHHDGKQIAKKNNAGDKFFYHPDHLSSTTLVTNESGDIVEEEFYLPYGDVYSGNEESRFLFTGKEKDKDTDLYYYGARYYDPFSRHFIQPDTIIQDIYNPQDLNRYAYVRNNPYKYTDPSGNIANLATGLIGVGVGGILGAVISIGTQLYGGGQVSWADVGKSTAIGAVSGGVAGVTFGLSATALGTASFAELSTGVTVGLGAASGVTAGRAGQFTSNTLYGQPLTQNLLDPSAIVRDAAVGSVTAGVVKVGSNVFGRGLSLRSNYPASYRAQLQQTHRYLKTEVPDFKFGEHSLNSVLGRVQQGRIPSVRSVADTLKTGQRFSDTRYPGTVVYSKNNVRVHVNPKTNEVTTVTAGPLSSSRFSSISGGGAI